MKFLNIITAVFMFLTVGVVHAEQELSSLIQWEESQNGSYEMSLRQPASNDEVISQINAMEATAAGQEQFSSLVQWEEEQYAQPYSLVASSSDEKIIENINNLEATAAGGVNKNEFSSLIQWEESF